MWRESTESGDGQRATRRAPSTMSPLFTAVLPPLLLLRLSLFLDTTRPLRRRHVAATIAEEGGGVEVAGVGVGEEEQGSGRGVHDVHDVHDFRHPRPTNPHPPDRTALGHPTSQSAKVVDIVDIVDTEKTRRCAGAWWRRCAWACSKCVQRVVMPLLTTMAVMAATMRGRDGGMATMSTMPAVSTLLGRGWLPISTSRRWAGVGAGGAGCRGHCRHRGHCGRCGRCSLRVLCQLSHCSV